MLNMRLSKAKNVLSLNGIKIHRRGHGSIDTMTCNPKEVMDALLKDGWHKLSMPYITFTIVYAKKIKRNQSMLMITTQCMNQCVYNVIKHAYSM